MPKFQPCSRCDRRRWAATVCFPRCRKQRLPQPWPVRFASYRTPIIPDYGVGYGDRLQAFANGPLRNMALQMMGLQGLAAAFMAEGIRYWLDYGSHYRDCAGLPELNVDDAGLDSKRNSESPCGPHTPLQVYKATVTPGRAARPGSNRLTLQQVASMPAAAAAGGGAAAAAIFPCVKCSKLFSSAHALEVGGGDQ